MSKVVCFDTETTGRSKVYDELIQITIVDENCNILLESYIRPVKHKTWEKAQKVNHISPEMVQDAPTAEELAPQIEQIMKQADYIVGYNVQFDIGFLQKDCGIEIPKEKVVDSLKLLKDECKKKNIFLPRYQLGNAIDFYCPEAKSAYLENAHDAACDAIATMKVYEAQIDKERPRHYTIVDQLPDRLMQLLEERVPLSEEKDDIELD